MHRAAVTTAFGLALLVALARTAGAEQIMRVADVRPGMQGHGMTVLSGTEPERFEVEVIGVLHQFLTKQDLILIRMRHPVIERTGTAGGMSGSPIYLEGRLAGALAYGWRFALDPIAGVTPIESMLEELDRPLRSPPVVGRSLPQARSQGERLARAGRFDQDAPLLGPTPAYWERFRDTEGPSPAMTPLLVGGFSARVRRLLSEALSDYGIVPIEAGGGGPRTMPRAGRTPFVPGSAIGVQLMRGDMSATAIGTVTSARGSRVLAFGHPMFNYGEQRYPVTTARILTVLASSSRSFKIGEAVAEAGALVQDRQSCIVADTTLEGPMTDMRVRLHDRTTGRQETYEAQVVADRFLLPVFGLASVASSLDRSASDLDDLTVTMRGAIRLRGGETIALEDHAFSEVGIVASRALFGMRPLAALSDLLQNPFEPVGVERVDLELELDFRRDEAEIVSAYVTSEEPEAGSRIPVHVVLRPFAAPEIVQVVEVEIPRSAAGQEVTIEVGSGSVVRPPVPEPHNLHDLVANLSRTYPATSLVVSLMLRSQGVTVRGQVAEDLPPSALDALRPVASDLGEEPLRTAVRVTAPAGRVVSGSARVEVRVRAPDA